MKSQKSRRLLMPDEAAEMLNLTLDDIQWLVGQAALKQLLPVSSYHSTSELATALLNWRA